MKCFEISYKVIGTNEDTARTVYTILFAEDVKAAKALISESYNEERMYDFKLIEEHIIEPKIIYNTINYFGDI